jgi:hypothetical protein
MRSFGFAIFRNLISVIIVVSLCLYYYNQTNRVLVWIFIPISLIPLVITIWDHFYQEKLEKEDLQKKK